MVKRIWRINTFGPKLLYRASRDGFSANEFHKRCDGKKNTLTLVKAKWEGVNPWTIGGYLDQPWTSNNQFISSSKSFIFSTTAKLKAKIEIQESSACGLASRGPTFGHGYDLVLLKDNNDQGYMNPYSYTRTSELIGERDYLGSGYSQFKALEIEVYTLD